MASLLEVVRRLTIVARSEGVQDVTQKLKEATGAYNAAGAAAEDAGNKSERSARRHLSAARAFDGLKGKLDDSFRSQQQFAQALGVVERAARQGVGTQEQHVRMIELAAKKYLGAAEAARLFAASVNSAQSINARLGVRDDFGSQGRLEQLNDAFRQADDLKAKYVPLYAAARNYRQELTNINEAAKTGVISDRQRAEAIGALKNEFARQVRGIKEYTAAQGDLAKQGRLTRWEMINLGRQIQDIGVGVASGQSAFLILAQQGTQIYDIFRSSETSFGSFVQRIASGITPMRLLGGTIAVTGTAALLAANSWKNWATQIDDLARTAGVSATAMLRLRSAAEIKGIDSQEFTAAITRFSQQVYFAKDGLGELAEFLRANGMQARSFEEAFGKVANLIQRAPDDMTRLQLLQRAGLPATMEWVRLLSKGQEGIREALEKLGGVNKEFDPMVKRAREFDEAWATGWTNFKNYAKSSIGEAMGFLAELWKAMPFPAQGVGPQGPRRGTSGNMRRGIQAWNAAGGFETEGLNIEIPLGRARQSINSLPASLRGAGGVAGAIGSGLIGPEDNTKLRQLIAQEQQRIGVLGELATASEQVRAKQLELNLAALSGAGISENLANQVKELTRIRAEERRQQEGVALGIFDEQKARQLDNDAIALEKSRRDSLIKTIQDETRARIARNKATMDRADQAYIAGSPLEGLARIETESSRLDKQLDQMATSSLQGVSTALVDMGTGAKSAGDAFADMGKTINRAIMQMVVNMFVLAPLAKTLQGLLGGFVGGGGGGGGGGAFANAGFGLGGWWAHGGVFNQSGVVPFASGGIVTRPTVFPFARGIGLMGEAGPEAIMPLRRTLGGRLGVEVASGGGRSAPTINVHNYGQPANVDRVETSSDGTTIDVFMKPLDAHLAQGIARGTSATGRALSARLSGATLRG